MDGSLKIDLFGPMRVLVEGEPIPRVRSRKALWLLALLALREGRPAAREWIADALWPDAEGGQGLANLRPLISELRTALGSQSERLRMSDRTVSLDIEGATIDACLFDDAIRQGNYTHAVELYKGDLLEGCNEEWAIQEQQIRKTHCLSALQSVGESATQEGRFDTAVIYFTRAIGMDPLRDAPRRALMSALASSGDVNAALQAYREFARLLSGEVGTLPASETTRLYEQLRADLKKPVKEVSPTPNNLAQPLNVLVGREDELADVEDLLRKSRLVTLTGVGGIGKTRLAETVAFAVLSEYPHGVWIVPLEALADEVEVPGAVAAALGVRESQSRGLAEGIAEALHEGKSLLVLDNCEHLLDGVAALIIRLLKECPNLRILATSREVLCVPGEAVWHVPPLAFPSEENLPEGRSSRKRVAEGYDSVRLFVERAKASQATFELTEENLPSVIAVCAQVEGLPLGIELAAARVHSMSVETLRERLSGHYLETLKGRTRGHSPRQAALRATIDWSYALLSDEDRHMMAQLAVFAGGWSLEAAEWVCGKEGTDDGLRSLIDKSIVVFDDRSGRYRFLETVRQYAEEKLLESGQADSIRASHRAWCVDFAERAKPGFRAADQGEWLKLADQEWPNLKKALDYGDLRTNIRLVAAIWYYWYIRSMRDTYRYLEETLVRSADDDILYRAEIQLGLGVVAFSDCRYDASRVWLRQSFDNFQSIADKRGAGRALAIVGNVVSAVEGREASIDYYESSLVLSKQAGDLTTVAQTLGNLAMMASQMDEYARALVYYEEGLRVARELGADRSLAYLLIGLANHAHRQGKGHHYSAYEQEALELFQKLGDKRGMAMCLRQQGSGAWRRGFAAMGVEKIEASCQLFHEIGASRDEAYTTSYLARAVMETGDLNGAELILDRALETLEEQHDRHGIADCHYVRSMILRKKGELELAWPHLLASLVVWTENNDRSGVADCLDMVAELASARGKDEHAAYFFGATEALREAVGTTRIEIDEPSYQDHRSLTQSRLGAQRFDNLVETGRSVPWREAADRAKELFSTLN